MLMGFISLILLALEDQITWICVANQPLDWIESDSDWASGSPCCTLGNQYWENLPHATGGEHRRMEEVDFMREQAAEAWSPHRRLGAINLHTSLLRESCPSRKYVTDVDTFTHPIMPPVPHPFDCPANGKNHEGARVDDNPNGVVTASFMDPLALHHVHTLIFLTACWHVTYTMGALPFCCCCCGLRADVGCCAGGRRGGCAHSISDALTWVLAICQLSWCCPRGASSTGLGGSIMGMTPTRMSASLQLPW
jgi:hypothetical protein